jgi:hypothetical protein
MVISVGQITRGAALTALLLSPAVAAPPTEHEVKAAYLNNFAKFVEWPVEALRPGDPFVIGVLGQDPLADALVDLFQGAEVRGHRVVIENRRAERALRAHVLFIAGSESFVLPRVLRELEGRPVLTVSDMEGFLERGGMVRFLIEDQRVRFEINHLEAQQAGLTLSSQLLRIARRVVE